MPSVQITPEETIDPAMLFQWFVVVSKKWRAFDTRGHELQAQSVSPPPLLRPETFSEKQISLKQLSE